MPLEATTASPTPSKPKSQGLTLNVSMPDGGWVAPPARNGERLVDALAAFGLQLRGVGGDHGGNCPCRVRVLAAWHDRLAPPSPSEAAQLDTMGSTHERSRVLSHLVMTPALDGLEMELDWDALEPQTYWIAG